MSGSGQANAFNTYAMDLDEGDRQLMLLALAQLALIHPGFNDALGEIAKKVDNLDFTTGRPQLFDEFKAMRARMPIPPAAELTWDAVRARLKGP